MYFNLLTFIINSFHTHIINLKTYKIILRSGYKRNIYIVGGKFTNLKRNDSALKIVKQKNHTTQKKKKMSLLGFVTRIL